MSRFPPAWLIRTCVDHRFASRALLAAALAVLVGGCLVGPDYRRPRTGLPDGWAGTGLVSTTNPSGQPSIATAGPADVAAWWTTFDDPTLNTLVERASTDNLTLRQASARIRQARAVRTGAEAGLLPQLNTTGGYRRTFNGGTITSGSTIVSTGAGGTATTRASRTTNNPNPRDLFQVGFDASWELDVFGGVRRNVEAATADLEASVDDRRDLLVTMLSEVALNYLNLRGFQQEIAIARQNLEAQQRTLAVTRRQVAGGLKGGLDQANAEALVASTSAQIPNIEAQAQQAIYALSVLLGKDPAALLAELSVPGPVPPTPPEVPVGLPSELLRRRPDVRRAERQLAAATARVGVATAELFPRFTLTGTFSEQGTRFGLLGRWDNRNWSFGPSFSWPIFDFGRIRANIAVQNAVEEEALYGYEQTVLVALQDVESSLIAYAKEQQRRETLKAVVAANQRAVGISTRLYEQGFTDFLNVLDAQRSLLSSQDALVQSNLAVSTNLVAVYKSLGGGWEGIERREREQGREVGPESPIGPPTTAPAAAPPLPATVPVATQPVIPPPLAPLLTQPAAVQPSSTAPAATQPAATQPPPAGNGG